jgi:hypothetical protein
LIVVNSLENRNIKTEAPFKMSGKKDPTSDLPDPSSSSSTEFPTQAEAEAEADALLAKEMNQLSVEEREKVLEDVHGIARVIDEPQEFIEACLALLEKELTNISSRAAYDLASSMSKEYTSSNKMRLMFLRAESFDPNKAASHMVAFFDEKYKLFGAEKLTKDIVLADLDPDDIVALESGSFQVLPEKDSAGRKVFCTFPHVSAGWTTQNKVSVGDSACSPL